MYNYWGFTDQISQKVIILNTKKSLSKIIAGVSYQAIKIASDKYYGTTKITIDGNQIVVSDKERTLVDLIFNPISSWEEVQKIYKNNLNKVDLDKLSSYIIKFPVGSVRKRAGYILETSGCPDKYLNKIKKSLGNKSSYDCFNPFKKTRFGTINKEWGLILNG
jgi:predicted transcriptional regulator of viral defense system